MLRVPAGTPANANTATMKPENPLAPPNAAPLNPGDLVTETEAAAILACAVQTLRNYRWRGCGPRVTRVGLRMVRYRRTDLAAFLEAGNGAERAA